MAEASSIHIRGALPTDARFIVSLIRELAEYERLSDACSASETALSRHLFSATPVAEAVIGSIDGEAVAFALFFQTFSTFRCAPSLYLEDLYVRQAHRRRGMGEAMLRHLARLAVERGCARFEWSVLEWNAPAIAFYRKLGARTLDDWRMCRVDGSALTALGGP